MKKELKQLKCSKEDIISGRWRTMLAEESVKQPKLEEYYKIQEMAYPASFNMEEFKQLTSFEKRYKYCKDKLKYVARGSSRYVFIIDDEKVLKLARNLKGVEQNEREYDMSREYGIVAQVYDCDDRYLWIEMERTKKITKLQFQNLSGIRLETLGEALRDFESENTNHYGRYYPVPLKRPDYEKELLDDDGDDYKEVYRELTDMIINFDQAGGDMAVISSWGVNAAGDLKLIDAGLSMDIWEKRYARINKLQWD
jgi:hypothetical protein